MNPLKANEMPHQEPLVRNKNFLEVATGYDAQTAMDEALRCLHCKHKPCISGCPVQIHIPDFIAKVAEGDFEAAYQIISESSSLPAVCGRVCPQERQCESKCVRGIKGDAVSIGRLERFVADWHNSHCKVWPAVPERNGHKVAVIGSGPSGLTCAGDLARLGYDVTVFEALHIAGGVLVYGIPEFRLPKKIVELEVNGLKALGVKIVTNVVIGRSMSIDDLFDDGFEAVYIGSGAGLPRFMGIPGESLKEVYSANEYLTRVNLMKAYQPGSTTPIYHARKVAVVGGGNVAMDAARCAKRLGAENVYIVYRRGMAELPARKEEVEHAEEEGIVFKTLTNPTEVLGDETGVTGALLRKTDGSERRIEISGFFLAIGHHPNTELFADQLELDAEGYIRTEPGTSKTSVEGVFAAGDVQDPHYRQAITAAGSGCIAALDCERFLLK